MNQNYSSYAATLSCLFPSIEEITRFEYEGSSTSEEREEDEESFQQHQQPLGKICQHHDMYAIADRNVLTIFHLLKEEEEEETTNPGTAAVSSDIIKELEFDNSLELLQWDISGACLALSDCFGKIHLVNRLGVLLFSKQMFSVATGVKICGLQFIGKDSRSQSLCAVLSNGTFLAIRDLDMIRLSELNENQLTMIPQFLKQAKFLSVKLIESDEIVRAMVHLSNDRIAVIVLNHQDELIIYDIPVDADSTVKEVIGFTPKSLIHERIKDMRLINLPLPSVLFLTYSGRLGLESLEEEEEEAESSDIRWANLFLENHVSKILALNRLPNEEPDRKTVVYQLLLHQVTVDGKTVVHFFTIIINYSAEGEIFTIIVPHGNEEDILKAVPCSSLNAMENDTIIGLIDNNIAVYRFTTIAHQFSSAFLTARTEVSAKDCTFEFFLSYLFDFILKVTSTKDLTGFNEFQQHSLDRPFPYEIVVSISILLDFCGELLDEETFYQCLVSAMNVFQNKKLHEVGFSQGRALINKFNHYYRLGKRFSDQFLLNHRKSLNLIAREFFPLQMESFIESFLLEGKLEEVLFLLHHHIAFRFPENMIEIMTSVPQNAAVDLLTILAIAFIDQERKLLYSSSSYSSSVTEGAAQQQRDFLEKLFMIVKEVFHRCREQSLAQSEQQQLSSNENEVIRKSHNTCSELLKLCKSFPLTAPTDEETSSSKELTYQSFQQLIHQLIQFEEYLKIILLAQRILKISYSLEEVIATGVKGLLFSCLNSLPIEELPTFITNAMKIFLAQFQLQNDSFLQDWIEEGIQEYLLTSSSLLAEEDRDEMEFNDGDDEEDRAKDAMQRLQNLDRQLRITTVLDCLNDRFISTSLLLKLFNIPSIESLAIHDLSHRLYTQLITLGKKLSEKIDGPIYDQLSEAIRLFRMKCIALRYHIQSFDIKDRDHLLFVVSIILNSSGKTATTTQNKIEDALAFAMDETTAVRIDCKPALIRIIIYFFQMTEFSCNSSVAMTTGEAGGDISAEFEEKLKSLFDQIPRFLLTIIFEDVLSFCMDEINELCDNNQILSDEWEANDDNDGSIIERKKNILQRYCKGCIKLLEYYDDLSNASSSSSSNAGVLLSKTAGPVSASPVGIQASSPSTAAAGSVKVSRKLSPLKDSRVLQSFKSIFQLQRNFNVYFNFFNLKSSMDCKKLIESLASTIVTKWKKSNTPSNGNDSSDVNNLLTDCFPLKKVCSILDCSCQIYVFFIAKQLIASGKKMQSLEFLRLNADELLSNVASNTLESAFSSHGVHNTSSDDISNKSNIQNWNLMVDGANVLCYAALKNERSTKSYGYYAQASTTAGKNDDKVFEINAYALSQLILRNSILHCDSSVLSRALDALTLTDTVLTVYDRIEKDISPSSAASIIPAGAGVSNPIDASTMVITIGDNVFNKDGLLMAEDSIRGALTQYCIQEMKRREVSNESVVMSEISASSASSTARKSSKSSSSSSATSSVDVENLISTLQKFENHLIAMQILFRSWTCSAAKVSLLRSSLTSLCRKILTYHNIDTSFAVACLSALPIEVIIKELKAAVPTIQSDFSRLHTVALIGEEIAYLCDQESLLLLFQSLQTNAKWWYLLSNIGLSIDLKLFQHSDDSLREQYIESLIPEILKRNDYQLDLLLDYCQSFDLKPEKACLCYLELIFVDARISFQGTIGTSLSSATVAGGVNGGNSNNNNTANLSKAMSAYAASASSSSSHWIQQKLKMITNGIHENIIRNYLLKILLKINPFDYEKIHFLCQWLIEITPDGHETEHSFSTTSEGMKSTIGSGNNPPTIYEGENEDEEGENSVLFGALNSTTSSTISGGIHENPRKSLLYWLNNYSTMIDIINLLNSIHLPVAMIQKIRKIPQIDKMYKKYESTAAKSNTGNNSLGSSTVMNHSIYDHRFPLWILLINPYLLFEPILDEVITVFNEKLTLLLMLLQLNIEDFTIRSIYAYYLTLLQQPIYQNQVMKVIEIIEETIRGKLGSKSILHQVKVWECIYEKEVNHHLHNHHSSSVMSSHHHHNNKKIAMIALEKILELFQQERKYASLMMASASTATNTNTANLPGTTAAAVHDSHLPINSTMIGLESAFAEKLKKLHIEYLLIKFFQLLNYSPPSSSPSVCSTSSSLPANEGEGSSLFENKEISSWVNLFISYPQEMMKVILSLFIEYFWNDLLHQSSAALLTTSSAHTADTLHFIMKYSMNTMLIEFLEKHQIVKELIQLAGYCAELHQPSSSSLSGEEMKASEGGSVSGVQFLHSSIIRLINYYLTEMYVTFNTSNPSSSVAAGNSTAVSTMMNGKNSAVVGNNNHAGWEFTDSSLQTITGSKAEHRRHEDYFLAFAINVLTILTGATEEYRFPTIQYLDSIMRMNGTENMRRFNTRSRLRSAIAMSFLASNTSTLMFSNLLPYSSREKLYLEKEDILNYVSYYYLLSEIQEIRLSTSEEIILHCLSFQIVSKDGTHSIIHLPSSSSSSAVSVQDSRGLVGMSQKENYSHVKSVISTWMHDEGSLMDVMELACDLFYLFYYYQHHHHHHSKSSSSCSGAMGRRGVSSTSDLQDFSLLTKMIQIMVAHQQYRVLYRFLLLLSQDLPVVYESLLYTHEMNRSIVDALFTMMIALLEKAQQNGKTSSTLINAKNESTSTHQTRFVSSIFGELLRIPCIANDLQTIRTENQVDGSNGTDSSGRKGVGKIIEEADKENQSLHANNLISNRPFDGLQKDNTNTTATPSITATTNKEMALLKSIYSPTVAQIRYPSSSTSFMKSGSGVVQSSPLLVLIQEVSGILLAFYQGFVLGNNAVAAEPITEKYNQMKVQLSELCAMAVTQEENESLSFGWKKIFAEWNQDM